MRSAINCQVTEVVLLSLWLTTVENWAVILPSAWEVRVARADFIGVVECEVAGTGIAQFRVLDAWKGTNKAGSTLRLGIRYNVTLYGSQFLVFGFARKFEADPYRDTFDPLLENWSPNRSRRLRLDYYADDSVGLPLAKREKEERDYPPLLGVGSERRSLEAFKKDVLRQLRLNPVQQEVSQMQGAFRITMALTYTDEKTRKLQISEPVAIRRRQIWGARSPEEIVSLLLAPLNTPAERWEGVIEHVLLHGGPSTLGKVIGIPPEDFPGPPWLQGYVVETLLSGSVPPSLRERFPLQIKPAAEATSLRRLTERMVRDYLLSEQPTASTREALTTLRQDVARLRTPQQVVERLLRTARTADALTPLICDILQRGANCTLGLMEAAPEGTLLKAPYDSNVAYGIRRRLGLPPLDPSRGEAGAERLSLTPRRDLAYWRDRVRAATNLIDASAAFMVLTAHDPATAADFLRSWPDTPDPKRGQTPIYRFVSYYGWHCPHDRERHLRTLLSARNPVVRTGAAAYLCFENKEAGLQSLRGLADLPDGAGAWAALTLARRGDKSMIDRTLWIFSGRESYGYTGTLAPHVMQQLLVLFSNSAKAGGVAPPREPYPQWWQQNRDRLTLTDPWLPELERLKIE